MTKEDTGRKRTKAKAKRKPAKPKAAEVEMQGAEDESEEAPLQVQTQGIDQAASEQKSMTHEPQQMEVDATPLTINVTRKLQKKLIEQAHEEGVSLDEYISEILAESVTLRAWEILERNAGMKTNPNRQNAQNQGNSNQQSSGGNRGNRGNQRGGNKGGRRGMSHSRYQNIMDDQAAFREYVRNQERKNGNR